MENFFIKIEEEMDQRNAAIFGHRRPFAQSQIEKANIKMEGSKCIRVLHKTKKEARIIYELYIKYI
jgi:hypothetical protein